LKICLRNYQLIFIILLSTQFVLPASAAIYKCKTANGQTIYSSKKCVGNSSIFSVKKEKTVEQTLNKKLNKPSVDIYIKSWCPYCKKAIAYLRSNNIPFNSYNIENNAYAKSRKQKIAPGYTGVPLTVINGQILKGFSSSRFDKALNL